MFYLFKNNTENLLSNKIEEKINYFPYSGVEGPDEKIINFICSHELAICSDELAYCSDELFFCSEELGFVRTTRLFVRTN